MILLIVIFAFAASCFLGAVAVFTTDTEEEQKAKLFGIVAGILSLLLFLLGFWLTSLWR